MTWEFFYLDDTFVPPVWDEILATGSRKSRKKYLLRNIRAGFFFRKFSPSQKFYFSGFPSEFTNLLTLGFSLNIERFLVGD